jgi:hypothetical protein
VTVREVSRRLRAREAGRPLPRYETIHHAIASPSASLVVAFVRMAGESRPWGIAWGQPGAESKIRSVPDGRVRDDVSVMCAEFAEDLLGHLRVHNWTYDPIGKDAATEDLRQVWVPNGQHAAMLHHLAYAYSQTKFGGDNREILNAFGRVAGWLFRDSSRRGNQHLVDASAVMREAYVFPANDMRQAHLGYLIAWLDCTGDRDARMAAAQQAERAPVSPTMDPDLERNQLEKPVERRRALLRSGGDPSELNAQIADVLADELRRRWALCAHGYDLLAKNERRQNAGVPGLVKEAMSEFWYQHQRIELNLSDPSQGPAFVAHPETDFHGSAAASRYLTYAAADEAYLSCLIHDDIELFNEALQDGRAMRGRVVAVRDDGVGKSTSPVWVIAVDTVHPQRIREGSRLVPRASRGHEASVAFVEQTADGSTHIVVHWIQRKTMAIAGGIAAKPIDPAWEGVNVEFVLADAASLTRRRSHAVWKAKDGPGAWLTHGRRPVPVETGEDDTDVEMLVDDVTQIEGDSA